jgi:type II secretion system protein N
MSEDFATTPQSLSESRSPFKVIGMVVLFLTCVILLTLLKLPEARITGFIQGMVQSGLDPYGIYLTDRGRELSLFPAPLYRLDHPVIELPDQTRVEFDELRVHPKLSGLFIGKPGIRAELKQGASEILVNAAGKGDRVDAEIHLENADLGKLGVFAFAAGLRGAGFLSGDIKVEGSLADPSTLNGSLELKLRKLRLDEQNFMGFQIPTVQVSEGDLNIEIKAGKILLKNVQIGKGMDDLRVQVTGDLGLNRYLNSSTMNLRAVLGLSDKLRQSFSILETLMASAKTPDGRYAYKLTGTLGAPMPQPDPGK